MEQKKQSYGFTIIEAFIAAVLFTLAVAGTMSLASRTLSFANETEDRLTATYLANEALSYVKNARQTNIIGGQAWLNVLETTCQAPNGCYIDTTDDKTIAQSVHACVGTCPPLLFNASQKIYQYATGTTTSNFIRSVIITKPSPDEAQVTVSVTWQGQKAKYMYTTQDTLFNWQ